MATTHGEDQTLAASRPTPEAGRHRWGARAATAAVAVPIVVSFIALFGDRWVPTGDESAILFHTARVGGRDTPLVGAYSTRGWAHPGPILYYLLAPGYRLLGSRPVSLFQAAALINIGSVALVGWLLFRRRQLAGCLLGLAGVATLLLGIRPELYVEPWNPDVPLLGYLAFLVACWGLLEDDLALLPLTVVLGGVLIQMHVGYLPLVVGAAFVVAAVATRAIRSGGSGFRPTRRQLRLAGVLGGVIWLPVLLDALVGQHNLQDVSQYFIEGSKRSIGLSRGLGLLSGHLAPFGPWSGGRERVVFAEVQPAGLFWLIAVVVLLGLVAGVHRMRRGTWPTLAMLALIQVAVGAAAAAKIEEPVLSYLVIWMLPLAAFCWLAIVLTALDAVDAFSTAPRAQPGRPLLRPALLGLATLALLVQTVRTTADAADPLVHRNHHAEPVRSVLAQLRHEPSDRVRVEGAGDEFNDAWVGVVYGLGRQGRQFFTSDGSRGLKWGHEHAWRGQEVDTRLTVATTLPQRFDDPVEACKEDPNVRLVAIWDQLAPPERRELTGLQIENYEKQGDLTGSHRRRFEQLSARAWRLAVFAGDRTCGGAPK